LLAVAVRLRHKNPAETGDCMMRMLMVTVALLAGAAPLRAATPFEPGDLYKISQVNDVEVSPDGKHILFTRNSADIATDKRVNEIWLGTLEGDTLRRQVLIAATAGAGDLHWSPDGNRIAYVAPWLGKSQIWVMSLADGVGRVITSGKIGAGDLRWSPDGRRIAFIGRIDAPPRKIGGMPEKPEGANWAPPPQIIDDFHYRDDGAGYVTPGADQLFVVDANGGTPIQLTKGDFDQISGHPEWTHDGKTIIYPANLRPGHDTIGRELDLWTISASGGAPAQLTDTRGQEDDPQLSPDGTMLAYIGAVDTPKFYAQDDLWVMPAGGGTAINVTKALDRPIIAYAWASDGRGLYAQYNDVGLTRVAFIPREGLKTAKDARIVVPEVGGTRLYLPSSGGAFSYGGGVFAYSSSFTDRPAGLGVSRGGKQIAAVDFNTDWRAGKTMGKIEEMHATSSVGGLAIQGWIQYPPNFDPAKKYPLILDIHGGPNTDYGPYFSITHQIYAAAGYIVLFTNPRGSIGYGEAFANGIDKTYPGDDHADLMSAVDAVATRPYIDGRNLFIGGGSGGGVLTTNAIAKTDRFRAAAVLRPVTDWTIQVLGADGTNEFGNYWMPGNPWEHRDEYWRRSTLSMVGSVKTPTILIDGDEDWRTPIIQSEMYYQALRIKGIPAELVRMPGAGHGMGRPSQWLQSILTVVDWYNKFQVK
jgi:dipeptidyl aminopeptidase/acylaminoacyl peptidase